VSVADLLESTATYQELHVFNEVYCKVGAAQLCGLFCRTTQFNHLLHVLGLRTAIHDTLGVWLPVFIYNPKRRLQTFPVRDQLAMIKTYLQEVQLTAAHILKPCFPVDPTPYSQALPVKQMLCFHGAYGCTERYLQQLFTPQTWPDMHQEVHGALSAGIRAGNVASLRSLMLIVGPIAIKTPELLSVSEVKPLLDTVGVEDLLPVVGSYYIWSHISSGQMLGRVKEALAVLKQWLDQADSMAFRVASWRQMTNHPESKMMPFVGNHAVQNRSQFYRSLERLESCKGLPQYLVELSLIMSTLKTPCLRLELLQYILGLDTRFSASVLRNTIDFSLKCILEHLG